MAAEQALSGRVGDGLEGDEKYKSSFLTEVGWKGEHWVGTGVMDGGCLSWVYF